MSSNAAEDDEFKVDLFALGGESDGQTHSDLASKLALFAAGGQVAGLEEGNGMAGDCMSVDAETQARLEALLEAAGIGKLSTSDGKAFADPEVLRRLTSSVSCALDEAAAALSRMRAEARTQDPNRSLSEACSDGDISTVRRLLNEGRSVHEMTEDGESLLSLACSAGYYELAEVLLSMRANIEDRGKKGECTPLMEAASGGYKDLVELLIAHGADVNATSNTGNSALTFACCGGYVEVVETLIEAGADLEVHNENGHTPLMEASSGGHVEVASLLLRHGAGINTHSNEFKESALTLACYKGHLEMVRFLLEAGADQEHKTDEMHTALMEASMDGHVNVARLLLDSGAHVNMPADSFESPLTLAACGGHVELASLLLLRGANVEEVNDEGYTPLMEASREGHEEMVAVLIAHGAKVNFQTEETQETALTLAACGGFLECCKLLIQAGANPEIGCSTPLMEAAQEGHIEIVKYLIEQEVNIHSQTSSGDTALSYACEHGHTDVAELLLNAGASLEQESEGGRTPLMKAARAGHVCTVQFLISRGADVNKTTKNNDHSVLSLACVYGHISVVELLLCHGADFMHKLKDNSTMLLEAAKGGHTNVVRLLLDFQQNFVNSPNSVAYGAQISQTLEDNAPRVPTQALPMLVPPKEPDEAPSHSEEDWHLKQLRNDMLPPGFIDEDHPIFQEENPPHFYQAQESAEAIEECCDHSLQLNSIGANPAGPTDKNLPPSMETLLQSAAGAESRILSELECRIKEVIEKAQMKTTGTCQHNQAPNENAADACRHQEEQMLKKQKILEELQKVKQQLYSKGHNRYDRQHPGTEQGDGQLKPPDQYGESDEFRGDPDGQDEAPGSAEENPPSAFSLPSPLASGVFSPADGGSDIMGNCSLLSEEQTQKTLGSGNVGVEGSPACEAHTCSGHRHLSSESAHRTDDGSLGVVTERVTFDSENVPSIDGDESPSSCCFTDVDCCTESNHDTPLTLACAGGHEELVQLLIGRNANIEHRDKKGFTPLILAATAGHVNVVSVLLDAGADIESQSERTKDTSLSLACSGGRQEVVVELLARGANKEHRNVSDYTPLSLAASGGYVRIIELLLDSGAEINSRTGSKLGISPLMLAAMNGHAHAVLMLLERGADINAQIETNRNTALTLACFQGRHEVVSLLVDRKANVEHRAKTGLTPLMEAASGGYTEVGKVLLEKGADVNAAPVPSSRDTALTIAADKGHFKFCELILLKHAQVDVRNKKGNTPLWLACNGGHLDVVQLLVVNHGADPNATDNRNITPLMAAFRKGHVKVTKWLVKEVSQFPSDAECMRYIATISDRELLQRCHVCMECIVAAKDRQAQEANKFASQLLEEIDKEKSLEESKKERAARKREKRKMKRKQKQELSKKVEPADAAVDKEEEEKVEKATVPASKEQKKQTPQVEKRQEKQVSAKERKAEARSSQPTTPAVPTTTATPTPRVPATKTTALASSSSPAVTQAPAVTTLSAKSPKKAQKREEGWKEVVRKSKRIMVASNLISRVIGRGGCNINAIREVTGAHIDIDKQRKGGRERTVTIRGPTESIRQAHLLIMELTKECNADQDIATIIKRTQVQDVAAAAAAPSTPTPVVDAPLPKKSAWTTPTSTPSHPVSSASESKTRWDTASAKKTQPIVCAVQGNATKKPSATTTPTVETVTKSLFSCPESKTSVSQITSLISSTLKITQPPAAIQPPNSSPAATTSVTSALPERHVKPSAAAVSFVAKPSDKNAVRPVQPVAPMVSVRSLPVKSNTSSAPAAPTQAIATSFSSLIGLPSQQTFQSPYTAKPQSRFPDPSAGNPDVDGMQASQSYQTFQGHPAAGEVHGLSETLSSFGNSRSPGQNSLWRNSANQEPNEELLRSIPPRITSLNHSVAEMGHRPGEPGAVGAPADSCTNDQVDRVIRPIGMERAYNQLRGSLNLSDSGADASGIWSFHNSPSKPDFTSDWSPGPGMYSSVHNTGMPNAGVPPTASITSTHDSSTATRPEGNGGMGMPITPPVFRESLLKDSTGARGALPREPMHLPGRPQPSDLTQVLYAGAHQNLVGVRRDVQSRPAQYNFMQQNVEPQQPIGAHLSFAKQIRGSHSQERVYLDGVGGMHHPMDPRLMSTNGGWQHRVDATMPRQHAIPNRYGAEPQGPNSMMGAGGNDSDASLGRDYFVGNSQQWIRYQQANIPGSNQNSTEQNTQMPLSSTASQGKMMVPPGMVVENTWNPVGAPSQPPMHSYELYPQALRDTGGAGAGKNDHLNGSSGVMGHPVQGGNQMWW